MHSDKDVKLNVKRNENVKILNKNLDRIKDRLFTLCKTFVLGVDGENAPEEKIKERDTIFSHLRRAYHFLNKDTGPEWEYYDSEIDKIREFIKKYTPVKSNLNDPTVARKKTFAEQKHLIDPACWEIAEKENWQIDDPAKMAQQGPWS